MEDDIYGNPDQAFAEQIAADDANKTFAQKFKEARDKGKGTVFYWKGKPVAAYLKGEEPASWTKSAAPSRPAQQAAAPAAPPPRPDVDPREPVYGANWSGMQSPDSGAIEGVYPELYLAGGLGAARTVAGTANAVRGYAAKKAAEKLATKQVGQRLGAGSSGLNERLAEMSRRGAERAALSPTRKAMGSATRSTAKEGSETLSVPTRKGIGSATRSNAQEGSSTVIKPRGMTPKNTESPAAATRPTKGMTPKSDTPPKPSRPVRGMNPKNRAPDDATDDIRDVVRRKQLGYAKGGSVRGGGIERRGHTKGRFVR